MTPEKKRELEAALEKFKDATRVLSTVWTGFGFDGTEMDGTYPSSLPSFDEFAHEVMEMEVTATAALPVGREVAPVPQLGLMAVATEKVNAGVVKGAGIVGFGPESGPAEIVKIHGAGEFITVKSTSPVPTSSMYREQDDTVLLRVGVGKLKYFEKAAA